MWFGGDIWVLGANIIYLAAVNTSKKRKASSVFPRNCCPDLQFPKQKRKTDNSNKKTTKYIYFTDNNYYLYSSFQFDLVWIALIVIFGWLKKKFKKNENIYSVLWTGY